MSARLLVLLIPAILSAQSPSPDHTALIQRMRDYALGYANRLQVPGGEFGSTLQGIFDLNAAATFEWDREEPAHSCVFRYLIPASTSTYTIQADADHGEDGSLPAK